jgi:hypothetical protein
MLGNLLGALMTSITLGLIIVFSLQDSSTVSTTQNTLSPLATIALGAIFLTLAFVVATGRWTRALERRRVRKTREGKTSKEDKGPPRWQQQLAKGSPRVTFVVGALLTLPGASYLAGLNRIHKLNYSTADTVLAVVGFNLIMMLLLEIPLVCFVVAPEWTPQAIDRAKGWIRRHAHAFAVWMLTVLGGLLVIKGLIELLS